MEQFSLPKKRGRPKKIESAHSQKSIIDEMEEIKRRINWEIQKVTLKNEPIKELHIQSRLHFPEHSVVCTDWEESNQRIKDFLNKYEELKKMSLSTYCQKSISEEEIDNDKGEEEDDCEEEEYNEEEDEELNSWFDQKNVKGKKTFKKPIKTFDIEAYDNLSDMAKTVLSNNLEIILDNNLSYQEQVETTVQLLHMNPEINESFRSIGALFGVSKGAISSYFQRMKRKKLSIGRPRALNMEHFAEITEKVDNGFRENHPLDIEMIVDILFNRYTISVKYNTLYKLIKNCDSLKLLKAPIMESDRADVPLEAIEKHYSVLNTAFINMHVPPCFVFNVDESGFIEYVDSKSHLIVLPKEAPNDYVLGIDRSYRRSTLVGCISLDGTSLKPLIVVPNKRVEKKLLMMGYGSATVNLFYQENGFINSQIFAYWAEHILAPEIQRRRSITGYRGDAILLLDGCSSHVSDYFLDICTYYDIYPLFEPPGSSDQVQALDLGIFGCQKHYKTNIKKNNELEFEQSNDIMQIINSWKRATTPDKIVSAFNMAGIYVIESSPNVYEARADVKKARAVRGIEHQKCHNLFIGNKTVEIPTFSIE